MKRYLFPYSRELGITQKQEPVRQLRNGKVISKMQEKLNQKKSKQEA
jgi:hypothetical protein